MRDVTEPETGRPSATLWPISSKIRYDVITGGDGPRMKFDTLAQSHIPQTVKNNAKMIATGSRISIWLAFLETGSSKIAKISLRFR